MQISPQARVHFEFVVRRWLGGYRWEENVLLDHDEHRNPFKSRTDVLVEKVDLPLKRPEDGPRWEVYRPLERESALFRIFGNVDVKNKDAIRQFADQYGRLLTVGAQIDWEGDDSRAYKGETIDYWRENVLGLRHWTKVWDFIQENDSRGLLEYVRWLLQWAKDERQSPLYPTIRKLIRLCGSIFDAVPAKRLTAARECLFAGIWQTEVRRNLDFYTVHDKKFDRMRLCLSGEELVTALWAQFAVAVSEDKEYRYCRQCDKPYELDPDIARTNRYFCSHSCRLKAYRHRQKKAVKLHKQGKTLKAIADQLESDVTTVRGWIAAAKEKENGGKGAK